MPASRVTIRDVAAAAGGQPSTVSRVLREGTAWPSDTRDRVVGAAERLGYRPNLLARALSTTRAPVAPLLVPDVANAFFPQVALGAEEAARAAGYALLLCNTQSDPVLERAYLESLVPFQVPFAILVPSAESADLIREFASACRFVVVDRTIAGIDLPSVTVDNRLGARLATEHLLALGHHRIACVSGPPDASTARHRVEGYRDAVRAAGLDEVVLEGGFDTEDGTRAAERFLRLAPRPTGIVAANDLCALAIVRVLEDEGVHVPHDVSVVGFDDLAFAALVRPALTTVHQPARRMGSAAVEMAIAGMAGEPAGSVLLAPSLVVRESTEAR